MKCYNQNNLAIHFEKKGADRYTRRKFPKRHGIYTEIKTPDYEFHFNLKGQIKSIRGLNVNWPHPFEMLKRTDGNDWVFYTVGNDSSENGIISWYGEYYLPCLSYPSNSIWECNPFANMHVMNAFAAWAQLYANLHSMPQIGLPPKIKDFRNLILNNDEGGLYQHAKELHSIIGYRMSVLPPDTRYVDYEIIPLIIADGCLYHCNFCCVKEELHYQTRTRANIHAQIQNLKAFYNRDIKNYNAIFLGNHDALAAGVELISFAATEAIQSFKLENANIQNPVLFLFGSVDSLMTAKNVLFEELNQLPLYTYINIGLESIDAPTLASINKPLETKKIKDAFQKMIAVNHNYAQIEITCNFLVGEQLSHEHNTSLCELLHGVPEHLTQKGTVYLSPLLNSRSKSSLLKTYYEIKKQSCLPLFIYLIQRL